MKIKQIIIAGALLVSVTTFAQKDELKTLKKIYDRDTPSTDDIITYKTNLSKLETLASEEGDKVYLNFYKAVTPQLELSVLGQNAKPEQIAKLLNPKAITELANTYNATLDYEIKIGKKVFTNDINTDIVEMKPVLWQVVVALDANTTLDKNVKFKQIAEVLYAVYQLDKTDKEKLYLAANYDMNAQDYDTALTHLKELKASNYTGEGTNYLAKNKATDLDETFNTKEQRDNMVKLGTHLLPREEKLPSKKGEIVKNIALILINQGKSTEAITAIEDARKDNPEDVELIVSEANIYLKMNDPVNYKRLISEALVKSPNDEVLFFNLGVTCVNANQFDDAEKYYRKAIELKPDFINAYLNLADLFLKPDAKIVEDMNKIKGTSDSDLKKYNVLKEQRQKIFNKAMPLYEKAHQLDPKDDLVKSNLKSVYNFLELTDKVKALKAEN